MLNSKKLDTILASFNKVVQDLKALQARNHDECAKNSARIANLQLENETLTEETARAQRIQKNIEDIISAD